MTQSPTDLLAAYAAEMRTRDLPTAVVDKAATCLLDALGLSAVSDADEYVSSLRHVIAADRDAGDATLWPSRRRVAPLDGVLANAFAVHARFHDDNDISSFSHPGSLIVAPSLTLAEAGDASLDVVVRAIVAGYSSMAWLGAGGKVGWRLVSNGFRGSATFGCVGAAVAASVALGLDEARARNAISVAADISGGTVEPVRSGASSWRLQNATAAWRGALAARMGAAGLDGSADALGGPRGFLRAYTGMEPPVEWSSPPAPELILDSWVKAYPTLGDNLGVVIAARRIAGRCDADAIEHITIHQNAEFAAYPGTSYRGPFERPAQAMASTAFAVAAMLAYGTIEYEMYDRSLEDPVILRLIERTSVVPHEEYAFVDGVVEVAQAGEQLRGDAADEPRTTFYRDRTAARDAFAAQARSADGAAEDFADRLFAAVDSGPGGWSARDLLIAFGRSLEGERVDR